MENGGRGSYVSALLTNYEMPMALMHGGGAWRMAEPWVIFGGKCMMKDLQRFLFYQKKLTLSTILHTYHTPYHIMFK